jgi:hypothetical protein
VYGDWWHNKRKEGPSFPKVFFHLY